MADSRAVRIAEVLSIPSDRKVLRDLAKDVGLSESRLWHVFRETMGSSPREWAVARRLSRALELIETTDMAVKEIAYAVGFKHQSHFTRVFREVFGRPPLQYRRATAAQQENAIL
jgi:transcriptional regulator GlxA family with amidase domain